MRIKVNFTNGSTTTLFSHSNDLKSSINEVLDFCNTNVFFKKFKVESVKIINNELNTTNKSLEVF